MLKVGDKVRRIRSETWAWGYEPVVIKSFSSSEDIVIEGIPGRWYINYFQLVEPKKKLLVRDIL